MTTALQKFLGDRKLELLSLEKRAKGPAQLAMTAQIQMADSILRFLATQQLEEDMTGLRLTLDKQATPVDDIKPRQDNQVLTEALIALATELVAQVKKEKKDLKYPLNNLPADVKPKSVSTKIYALKEQGKLPDNVYPTMRTEKIVDEKTGAVTVKEILYMRCGAPGKKEKGD